MDMLSTLQGTRIAGFLPEQGGVRSNVLTIIPNFPSTVIVKEEERVEYPRWLYST